MKVHAEILRCSEALSPYIEYYKFISGTLHGAYKVVPFYNQELYFSFDHDNYSITSPGRYEVSNPHIFMTGLHDVGQEIYSVIPEPRKLKSFVIVFKPNGIQKLFRLSNSEIQKYAIDGNDVFKANAETILTRLQVAANPNEMKNELEYLLFDFIDKSRFDPLMQHICTFIRQHIGVISVNALSEKFHITPRTLQRRFMNEFGVSPKNYLQLVRINAAVSMLSAGTYDSLTDLAFHSGYYDQSHFIRDVKKTCDMVPGVMEKNNALLKCDNINFTKMN